MWRFDEYDRGAMLLATGFRQIEGFIVCKRGVKLAPVRLILKTISDEAFLRFVGDNK